MFVYELPLDPPLDDYPIIETIVKKACEEFLGFTYNSKKFEDLFDLMFEEIRENLNKYLN